ncbi:MAG: hypothetical protein CHACPFDD_01006 [Phycisphaerae bacterium]|nr:hypothetical protein [Phycisphaerae bacterium]
MSSIPPTWLSSIIQTTAAAGKSAASREKEQSEVADAARRAEQTAPANTLQNDDRDSSVDVDGGGMGGTGRQSASHTHEHDQPADEAPQEGAGGLDLQA